MKKINLILVMTALLSCSEVFDNDTHYYLSYGNVKADGSNWYIGTDNGNRLNIVENDANSFVLSEGLRVIASYDVLNSFADTSYDIHLYAISKVLTKNPVVLSSLTAAQIDSIGNDPVNVLEAWFGGNKYLNLSFELFGNNSEIVHYINLVYDDVASTSDTIMLDIRHNAMDDLPYYNSSGRVSFDISNLLPADKGKINIVLKFTDYNLVERRVLGTFDLGSHGSKISFEPAVRGDYWTNSINSSLSGYE